MFCLFCLQMVSRKKKGHNQGVVRVPSVLHLLMFFLFLFLSCAVKSGFGASGCVGLPCACLSSVNGVCLGSQVPLKRTRPPQSLGNWGLLGTWCLFGFVFFFCLSPLGADKMSAAEDCKKRVIKGPPKPNQVDMESILYLEGSRGSTPFSV